MTKDEKTAADMRARMMAAKDARSVPAYERQEPIKQGDPAP